MDSQQENKNSPIDKANKLVSDIKNVKKVIRVARATQSSLQVAQSLLSGGSMTGWWAAIVTIVITLILTFVITMLGAGANSSSQPACKSLTTDKTTINKDSPATLTLNDCPENVTYAWLLPKIGGSFGAPSNQTTTYTPPELNKDAKVKISVNVCSQDNDQNCSQYSIGLNISYAPPSYPGITYNLKGPNDCDNPCRVKKGESTNFNIEITYDEDKAQTPIENVSAALTLSTAVFTINSISGKTTAEFNPNLPLVKYLWSLAENQRSQDENSKIKTFNFKINLTPYVNNIETSITLDMLIENEP